MINTNRNSYHRSTPGRTWSTGHHYILLSSCDKPSNADTFLPTTVTLPALNIAFSKPSFTPFPSHLPSTESSKWSHQDISPVFKDTPEFVQRWIGQTPPSHEQCCTLREELEYNFLLVCSGGAYCPINHQAAHGWVIASKVNSSIVDGTGPIDGHPDLLLSYCAELGGILASTYIIYRDYQYFNITTGKAILFCDNKGAINKSFTPSQKGISPFLTSDYDLIHLIINLLAVLPVYFLGEWMKGHYTGKNRAI